MIYSARLGSSVEMTRGTERLELKYGTDVGIKHYTIVFHAMNWADDSVVSSASGANYICYKIVSN